MKYSVKKPGTPAELVHYGVKGMKWGVRKEEETGGGRKKSAAENKAGEKAAHNEDIKRWTSAAKAASKPVTPEQAAAAIKENEKKFLKKFEPSEAEGSGKEGFHLTETQKKLLIGAGVVGVGVGGAYLLKRSGALDKFSMKNIQGKPNEPIGSLAFQLKVQESKGASWFGETGYFHTSSMAREGFELPVGHTFHRISSKAETSFGHATYSTHSIEDFHRYISGFSELEQGGTAGLHHITWQATEPIRVPSTTHALGAMRRAMTDLYGDVSDQEVLEQYGRFSGGNWEAPTAKKFFEILKGDGYHAIVDEMDAGVIGETPLVFFGTDAVGPKSSKPLTKAAVKASKQNLVELANRKVKDTQITKSLKPPTKAELEALSKATTSGTGPSTASEFEKSLAGLLQMSSV